MSGRFQQDLHTAAAQGQLDVVQHLLHQGEEVDRLNADDQTALYCAAAERHRDVVQFLLQSGADPNGLVPTRPPRVNDTHDEDDELLEDEFDEDEEDEEDDDEDDGYEVDDNEWDAEDAFDGGDTPLLAACEDGDYEPEMLEVVRLLLGAGANVNAAGESGLTR